MNQTWDTFLKELPSRKDENWKYTDLGFLAKQQYVEALPVAVEKVRDAVVAYRAERQDHILLVVVNGYYQPMLSDVAKLPRDVKVSVNSKTEKTDLQPYPFARLNAACSKSGLLIEVADNYLSAVPLHILSLATDEANFIAQPRNAIVLGKNSHLVLVEEFICHPAQLLARDPGTLLDDMKGTGSHARSMHGMTSGGHYLMNIVNTITLNQKARLEYYKIQQESPEAVHVAHHFIRQYQDSQATFMDFSLGAKFARDEIVVQLAETGAECHTSGYYHLTIPDQYIDHHVTINHLAPHSHSEMLYKGILDAKCRAVFNGRLHVAKDAQKILAYQANHNLLLSKEAEVYSKPELEIYADDVKCKHGASTGQIDADAVFYLRSRGLSHEQAVGMLLQGFANDILQRIQTPSIKDYLQGRLA